MAHGLYWGDMAYNHGGLGVQGCPERVEELKAHKEVAPPKLEEPRTPAMPTVPSRAAAMLLLKALVSVAPPASICPISRSLCVGGAEVASYLPRGA